MDNMTEPINLKSLVEKVKDLETRLQALES